MLLDRKKIKIKNALIVAFIAQKTLFVNFGQLWMVVYTAKIKSFNCIGCVY